MDMVRNPSLTLAYFRQPIPPQIMLAWIGLCRAIERELHNVKWKLALPP
jgi:hypothetical protein